MAVEHLWEDMKGGDTRWGITFGSFVILGMILSNEVPELDYLRPLVYIGLIVSIILWVNAIGNTLKKPKSNRQEEEDSAK
ncbi:MAG: hypothetical protein ABH950_09245 [Candidatus Altiarchaeota archaeon]